MKKLCILVACLLLLSTFTGCAFNTDTSAGTEAEPRGFRWVKSESYFVDYTIEGSTVQFRYSFCFENNTKYDRTLNAFSAKFNRWDLRNWIRYQKFYNGKLENGDTNILVESGQKVNITLVFCGEYLGGVVCEELEAKNIGMCQRLSD